MSRIYFHSEYGCAEVSGSERAHMAILCTDKTYDLISVSADACRALRLRGDGEEWDQNLFAGMTMRGHTLAVGGRTFDCADMALNTALSAGPDTLRLAAILHAQCEIHCYVEGPNRAWLAGLIDRACEDGTLRREMTSDEGKHFIQGWDEVLALLRSSDAGPVVTSYSVTEGWPDVQVVKEFGEWAPALPAGLHPDEYEEAWYEAWHDEPNAWNIAMAALRKANETGALELMPDGFARRCFGHGETVMDLVRAAEGRMAS